MALQLKEGHCMALGCSGLLVMQMLAHRSACECASARRQRLWGFQSAPGHAGCGCVCPCCVVHGGQAGHPAATPASLGQPGGICHPAARHQRHSRQSPLQSALAATCVWWQGHRVSALAVTSEQRQWQRSWRHVLQHATTLIQRSCYSGGTTVLIAC